MASLQRRQGRSHHPGSAIRLCLQVSWLVVCILLTLTGCTGQPEAATPSTPHPPSTQAVATAIATSPATATVAVREPISIAGDWIGGYQLSVGSAGEQRVAITFSESAGSLDGEITFPINDVIGQLNSVTLEKERLSFRWSSEDNAIGEAIFEGQVSGQSLEGKVQQGGKSAPFHFVRSVEPAQSEYAQFAGTYRFSSGRAIGFYQTSGPASQVFATTLLYADLQSGELGPAFPIGGTTFAVGSAVGLAYPFKAEVTFVRDASGAIESVRWTEKGQPETVADKVKVSTEEIRYQSKDGIMLAGRLTSPMMPGKHPAVVIVHGAGEGVRQNWLTDLLGGLFALDGISTLSYDKRGLGGSGGTYVGGIATQDKIELLGQDALAGIWYLKGRADIAPTRIGMLGQSQAGWIIPFAAAQSSDVAFMVLWSGPGVTQGISDLYDKIADSGNRAEISQTLLNTTPWGFDPVPYLEKTSAPGYWAFGDRDMTVPVPESIANLEKVKTAGQKDFTWQTFPGANHYLFLVASTRGDDLRLSPGYPPGMLDGMRTWLRQHKVTSDE